MITICAKKFREALEKCDRHLLPIAFEEFPRGSCGDATLLLAKFLEKSGFGMFDYVCGEIPIEGGGLQSHAWLQRSNLIIDITADQFDEVQETVLVTRNHDWHNRFHSEVKHIADYEIFDEHTKNSLAAAYTMVISNMVAT